MGRCLCAKGVGWLAGYSLRDGSFTIHKGGNLRIQHGTTTWRLIIMASVSFLFLFLLFLFLFSFFFERRDTEREREKVHYPHIKADYPRYMRCCRRHFHACMYVYMYVYVIIPMSREKTDCIISNLFSFLRHLDSA